MPDRDPGFAQRTLVVVGPGTIETLDGHCRHLGSSRPVVLIDAALEDGLVGARIGALLPRSEVVAAPAGEPSFDSVSAVAEAVAATGADLVVAVGGGSTIDTAKLARGLIASGHESLRDLPPAFAREPMPLVAVATTAGTGAELGAGAVVADPEQQQKVLVKRQSLAAAVAIADSELTTSLPPHLTAFTGCDALAQAILAYVPAGDDSVAGHLALRALRLLYDHLPAAVEDGHDLEARSNVMLGAVLSAMAMYNSPPEYGGEHAFAEPLGTVLGVHHGHLVAAFLPGVAEFNVDALRPAYATIARELRLVDGVDDRAAADALVSALRELVVRLRIPPLRERVEDFPADALAARCAQDEAFGLNPRPITHADAVGILAGAYDGTFRVAR